MSLQKIIMLVVCCLSLLACQVEPSVDWVKVQPQKGDFSLVSAQQVATIIVAEDDFPVVKLAATNFAADINQVTDKTLAIKNSLEAVKGAAVIIGTLGKSPLIDQLVADGTIDVAELDGAWESFVITTLNKPYKGLSSALLIIGSDRRGTAFGVYEVSQAIGVSPWYWWADVTPEKKSELYISQGTHRFGPPSVKYRGIFINDEDWGMQVWAEKTFEPENGGIGPKTYAKLFELMLRLKANTVWPAMHPTTQPFNSFRENAKLADDYAIIMGSSHAEPMLRNNVGEWKAPPEQYNYQSHRDQVHGYWEERMRSNGHYENIYTLGMRGIHDSNMQGPSTDAERVDLLQTIFSDQRALINKHGDTLAEHTPQMFCAYKEVLNLYRQDLTVPDDVTIVWPDDNFGYVRNFASAEERKRSGGFGVYYHLSYLGAPMAYLWLNTTPPALIWEEMYKSYALGADRMWIANVGDLKPAEIGTDLFLQMAWDINRWQRDNIADFLTAWAAREFDKKHASTIADLMRDYYRLNFQRKPEHLQWWLPRTAPQLSEFNNQEMTQRLAEFTQLRQRTEQLRAQIDARHQDAFFQLVGYPIQASALANIRFIEGERGNRVAALAADAQLHEETGLWNTWLAKGKWKHFMSMEPADSLWQKYRIENWSMPVVTKTDETEAEAQQDAKNRQSFAVEAEDYTRKVDRANSAWELIPDLGRTGKGSMTVMPFSAPSIDKEKLLEDSPLLEYDLHFPKQGEFEIKVYLIPTHPISGTRLRFALAINDSLPEWVELDVNDGGSAWAQGVLNATRTVNTLIKVDKIGINTLKIYAVDAGVLLDKIEVNIDGVPSSYLGMPAQKH